MNRIQKWELTFGGRDHSTIISAYQKIEKDLETNYQLQTVIEELKKRI